MDITPIKIKIKQTFCKHEYHPINEEAVKFGIGPVVISKCSKCGKVISVKF